MQEKRDILQKVNKHVGSRVSLARNLGIPITTLATIIKNRESIEKSAIQCGPGAKKRMYIRASKYEKMEEILKEWFVSARASNIPVGGTIIREKALRIANRLNIEGFTASNGWIDRFKKRHNVVYRSICGESQSVDLDIAEDWKQTDVPTLITDYAPRDIFNADETGLFFNVLPCKTFSFKGEACHGGKLSKVRLTVLLITNSDGSEKLPPLVIGKSAKPRCFKNVRTLPTKYAANKKAWMTSILFEKQLTALDALMGVKHRKILLFLDRCPAHPTNLTLRNIQLAFFPPNCTSELQPLDLGIIRAFKHYYRRNLVQKLLCQLERGGDPNKFKMSILDAMHYTVKAWGEITDSTIKNCFRKAGIYKEQDEDVPSTQENIQCDVIEGWERISDQPLEDYVNLDSNVMTSDLVEVDDIVDSHLTPADLSAEELSDEEEVDIPTKEEAMRFIEGLKTYFTSFADIQDDTFKCLYSLERELHNKKTKMQQTNIHDFF